MVGDAHRVTDTTRIRVHQEADLPAFRCSPHAHTSKLRSALPEEPFPQASIRSRTIRRETRCSWIVCRKPAWSRSISNSYPGHSPSH